MAGYTGLTADFAQRTQLVPREEYESMRDKRRLVHIFQTKEDLLLQKDMDGELVIALDEPDHIQLVTNFDEVYQLTPFRKLRKPVELPAENDVAIDEENAEGDD